ncbi:hypothetical protein BDZ97DRAFT_1827844 [Flammula alnicola]|nr:hypothetical protein BDZ97DRAFT_1827844 [Flammula alnicola]
MLELYDSSPYSLPSQEIRLKSACALSKAHIKCLDLQLAYTEIIESLPYKLFTGIDDRYSRTYPHSVYLDPTTPHDKLDVDDPEMIFIHPQSQFYLDVHDNSRSMRGMLTTWISYFFVYTLRNKSVLPNGHLEPERAEVLRSLRPENQPYFDAFARNESCNTIEHAMLRKEILEKLGRYEEARRPLPLPPPGNPTLRAKHAANRANELANQKRPYSMSAFRGARTNIARLIRLMR